MFMSPLIQIVRCFSVNNTLSTDRTVEYPISIPGFLMMDLWWTRWQMHRFLFM